MIMSTHSPHHSHHFSRFIINVPESEIANTDRICFQIEQAHWYYEDFIRDDPTAALATTTTQSDGSALPPLPGYTLKRFAAEMFERCPLIADLVKNPRVDTEEIYRRFVAYKMNVPVCGAIILNDRLDKILLVRGWTSKSWTFPKGKINQNETEVNCAIREVNNNGLRMAVLVSSYCYLAPATHTGHGRDWIRRDGYHPRGGLH